MGLDMYLEGRRFNAMAERPQVDGYPVKSVTLDLGYWRKHPDLHGFIVQEFAEGKDECQDIYLDADCISKILTAIEDELLPHTEGFFFGRSPKATSTDPEELRWQAEQKAEDIAIFTKALAWLNEHNGDKEIWRHVNYRASW